MSRCADLHCGPSPYHGDALLAELHRLTVGAVGFAPTKGRTRWIYSPVPLSAQPHAPAPYKLNPQDKI